MDVFKQNRNLMIAIIILVLLNLVTISLLWFGKPRREINRGAEEDNIKVRIQKMLKNELGFSAEQSKQFIELRKELRQKTVKLNLELMQIKKEMFEQAMNGDAENISDSLLNLSLEKQGEIEKITFEHFLKLKQICTTDQQKKLFKSMHRLLGPSEPVGRPEGVHRGDHRDELPPPPGEFPPQRN